INSKLLAIRIILSQSRNHQGAGENPASQENLKRAQQIERIVRMFSGLWYAACPITRRHEQQRGKMRRIKFSITIPGGDRRHYLTEEDVMVVLSRLPEETWRRLRAVHFNDHGGHFRVLGYVTRGSCEI